MLAPAIYYVCWQCVHCSQLCLDVHSVESLKIAALIRIRFTARISTTHNCLSASCTREECWISRQSGRNVEITGGKSTGRWRSTKCRYYCVGLNDTQHSLTITWLDPRYITLQNRPRKMETVAKIPLTALSKLLLSLHEFSWKFLLLSGISCSSLTENFAVAWVINLWDKSPNFIWRTVKLRAGS